MHLSPIMLRKKAMFILTGWFTPVGSTRVRRTVFPTTATHVFE
jgi:hypothetical protein